MNTQNHLDDWIPLVVQIPTGRYQLSPQFRALIGLLWDDWEAQAFVAHLIGGFEHRWEHLLDIPDRTFVDGYPDLDVNWRYCEQLSGQTTRKYAETIIARSVFKGLPAEWYQEIYRSKLLSLKLPRELILQYRSHLLLRYDYRYFANHFVAYLKKHSLCSLEIEPLQGDHELWEVFWNLFDQLDDQGFQPQQKRLNWQSISLLARIQILESYLTKLVDAGFLSKDIIEGWLQYYSPSEKD